MNENPLKKFPTLFNLNPHQTSPKSLDQTPKLHFLAAKRP